MRPCLAAALGLMSALSIGCTTLPTEAPGRTPDKSVSKSCARTEVEANRQDYREDAQQALPPGHLDQSSGRLSARSQTTAAIIGADGIVARLLELESRTVERDLATRVDLLMLRQALSDRVLLAMLDLSRLRSESDCERERGDVLRGNLQQVADRRQRAWTIAGVVFGAMTSIVSGGLGLAGLDTGANATNVAGGLISAYSGMAAISDDGRIAMQTGRNLLRDLYLGPEQSDIFPPSTWRYLNRPLRTVGAEATVREDLIRQWYRSGVLGEPGSEAEQRRLALLTGEGGAYEVGDFAARNQMLDLFNTTLSSMNDDIEFMLRELTQRRSAYLGKGRKALIE